MKKHEQYNLSEEKQNGIPIPFSNSPSSNNIEKINKTLNIKDVYIFNDKEFINKKGYKFKRTPFSSISASSAVYSVAVQDYLIGITSLAFAPSIGLPLPSLVNDGKTYIVKDEVGGAATTTVTIRSEGEKTIDGATSATITTNYGSKEFYSDGANWFTK